MTSNLDHIRDKMNQLRQKSNVPQPSIHHVDQIGVPSRQAHAAEGGTDARPSYASNLHAGAAPAPPSSMHGRPFMTQPPSSQHGSEGWNHFSPQNLDGGHARPAMMQHRSPSQPQPPPTHHQRYDQPPTHHQRYDHAPMAHPNPYSPNAPMVDGRNDDRYDDGRSAARFNPTYPDPEPRVMDHRQHDHHRRGHRPDDVDHAQEQPARRSSRPRQPGRLQTMDYPSDAPRFYKGYQPNHKSQWAKTLVGKPRHAKSSSHRRAHRWADASHDDRTDGYSSDDSRHDDDQDDDASQTSRSDASSVDESRSNDSDTRDRSSSSSSSRYGRRDRSKPSRRRKPTKGRWAESKPTAKQRYISRRQRQSSKSKKAPKGWFDKLKDQSILLLIVPVAVSILGGLIYWFWSRKQSRDNDQHQPRDAKNDRDPPSGRQNGRDPPSGRQNDRYGPSQDYTEPSKSSSPPTNTVVTTLSNPQADMQAPGSNSNFKTQRQTQESIEDYY